MELFWLLYVYAEMVIQDMKYVISISKLGKLLLFSCLRIIVYIAFTAHY